MTRDAYLEWTARTCAVVNAEHAAWASAAKTCGPGDVMDRVELAVKALEALVRRLTDLARTVEEVAR